jgi:integrase
MIQLQLYTAARAGELCHLRPCDVDRSRDIWVYKPQQHKTAHRGFERKIVCAR